MDGLWFSDTSSMHVYVSLSKHTSKVEGGIWFVIVPL